MVCNFRSSPTEPTVWNSVGNYNWVSCPSVSDLMIILWDRINEESQSDFNCRYDVTVTITHTPSCFVVAVADTEATKSLADVSQCYSDKRRRRRRSIVEDKPFAPSFSKDKIMPSRWFQHKWWINKVFLANSIKDYSLNVHSWLIQNLSPVLGCRGTAPWKLNPVLIQEQSV